MKKCIFYLPYKLDENAMGARMLRPRKMIQAFKDIGYDVFVVEGYSKQRKALIKELKQNINKGIKYDFMYSESSTMPTLLTDPNHLPLHPFFDYSFFRYIHNRGIPIGLYYCDVYWKFDWYGKELPLWKKESALLCYRLDIHIFKKYLAKFYVADMNVVKILGDSTLKNIAEELLPGADNLFDNYFASSNKNTLNIFYVGGLGNHYQISELLKAINGIDNCELTLCCRENDWEKEKDNLQRYLSDRIEVIHKNNNELEPYYREADIGSLMFDNNIYMNMAKPFKAFEYLAHELPILSTKGTSMGDFVEKNDIGWNIEFSENAIKDALQHILDNPFELIMKKNNCIRVKPNHLWTSRASQVADGLLI